MGEPNGTNQPIESLSMATQLAEVYAIVGELQTVTERLREKMAALIDTDPTADDLAADHHEERT